VQHPGCVGLGWITVATFAHNHPSGVAQPSRSDELLTRNLREALALVEVRVLDHFVVAGNQAISFAERGLL
jgi:DNA repair protein RadC